MNYLRITIATGVAAMSCAGCIRGPAPAKMPDINAEAAARAALVEYDSDGNGILSRMELQSCPSILMKLSEYDTDGDLHVSADELAQRISAWVETEIAFVTGYTCKITYGRQPLQGAKIQLVPETFLGETIKPASGVSDRAGIASLAIADEDLSSDLRGLRGVEFGLYKVQITHPTKKVADQYNTNSLLGCEIYPSGDPEMFTYNVGPN